MAAREGFDVEVPENQQRPRPSGMVDHVSILPVCTGFKGQKPILKIYCIV